jgi:pimeloyl-ACP methyl ester carboxylesterase
MHTQLCFLHGLDSSPQGRKGTLLREHYPDCWIPLLSSDVYRRLEVLEREMPAPMLVVGSSLGGLTAILFAMKHPERVRGMVLLAPAVGAKDKDFFTTEQRQILESLYIPQGIPTALIAGLRDELIPVAAIQRLVERSPDRERIELLEVDDDHNLHESLGLMLETIEQLKAKVEGSALNG